MLPRGPRILSASVPLLAVLSWACIFPLPFVEEQDNHPPTILGGDPDEGEAFVLDLPENSAWVAASDEDEDNLNYIWAITGLGIQGHSEPFQGGSQITIQAADNLDGRTLSVTVDDGNGGTTGRSWPIVVVWEAR